jgi:hypothetical protein
MLDKRYKIYNLSNLLFKDYGSKIRQLLDLFKFSISSICDYLDGNNI